MKVLRKSLVMLTLILAVVSMPLASYAQSGSPEGTLTLTEKGKQALKAQDGCENSDKEYIKILLDLIYRDIKGLYSPGDLEKKLSLVGHLKTLVTQVAETKKGGICRGWTSLAEAVSKLEYAYLHDSSMTGMYGVEIKSFFKPFYKASFGHDPIYE